MDKLRLPKNAFTGIKIYCNKCKRDNPKCQHYSQHVYRVRVHVPGTAKKVRVLTLHAKDYNNAVLETIKFKEDLKSQNFKLIKPIEEGNDYSFLNAVIKYNQYLSGKHQLAQHKKIVSEGHRDESIRFCTYFSEVVKKRVDIKTLKITNVSRTDVSNYYIWAQEKFGETTFNKGIKALRAFFDYLIKVEEVQMKNPFDSVLPKAVVKKDIQTLNKEEFLKIIDSIDTIPALNTLGGKGEVKNMYRNYLKDGFRLMLLTGGRREEVVGLKWSNIYQYIDGTLFFMIENLKVQRQQKSGVVYKYIPINYDLKILLEELGYHVKKNSDDFIFYPDRRESTATIMNQLSKSFTFYKNASGISKEASMKNLRKTYITWTNRVLGNDTKLITSHSNTNVLKEFYLDPTVLSAIEKAALEVRIFG